MADHGFCWEQLREVPMLDLAPGDTWVQPALGSTWSAGPDGRLAGWDHSWHTRPPRGRAWTVLSRDGDAITIRSNEGEQKTVTIPRDRQADVLLVDQLGEQRRGWTARMDGAAPASGAGVGAMMAAGEVGSHAAALAYTAAMGAAAAETVSSLERTIAAMRGRQVGVDAIGHLSVARGQATVMAAELASAHRILTGHTVIGEAYAVAPDAGDKPWMSDDTGASKGVLVGVGAAQPPDYAEENTVAATPPAEPAQGTKEGVRDRLRVGSRMVLRDGETFAGSAAAVGDEGLMVLAAAVDTPDGRVVHVAVPVYEEAKGDWKGAHAPAQESRVDPEEGHTYEVDTHSDVTAVIGADALAELPARVDDVITTAARIDREYRQLVKQSDRLHEERMQLEVARFDDAADADLQLRLDSSEKQHHTYQQRRRALVQDCVDRLGPDDRARYENLQRRIAAAAGVDRFEPGREDLAADVCGLTVPEYRELVAIRRTPYLARTRAEQTRHDELSRDRQLPLLAEQAAIIHGLSVDEYREWKALDNLGEHRPAGPHRNASGRTAEQQARYDLLQSSPRGATGATPGQTAQIRSQFDTYQEAHHSDKLTWAAERQQRADLAARARPLDQADAARLEQVIAEHDMVNDQCGALGGETTAHAEIPGRDNAKLVIEAVQREEEGGVDYHVHCMPPHAAEDWSPGGDPYRTTASGLRKLAKTLADLGAGQ